MSRTMRWISAVLVTVLLTAGAAQAWAPAIERAPVAQQEGGILAGLWDWLLSLFAGDIQDAGDPGSVQEKSGCGMDPDGVPSYCT